MWFLYNLLFAIGYVVMLPKFVARMLKRGGYGPGFMQRFAHYGPELLSRIGDGGRIWVHAVSVGEVFVALRFMSEIRAACPGTRFVLTTTTSTGHRIATDRLPSEDVLLYFPADFPLIVRRAVRQLKPRALILTECELWPNLLRRLRAEGVPVFLINGRISDSSFRGYRILRPFFRRLADAFSLMLVQTDEDASRLRELGTDSARLVVMGSAKYDVARAEHEAAARVRAWLAGLGIGDDALVMVGGSTWAGEEGVLVDCVTSLRPQFPNLHLVLVPRHAERRAEIESVLENAGVTYVKRSEGASAIPQSGPPVVVLADTTGELVGFYNCATVVFVGKSLTQHGGQNIIEPALLGKPVIVGPNMENFPVVMADFLAAEAIVQVTDATELGREMADLFSDPARRDAIGQRAHQVVIAKGGVIAESVARIVTTLGGAPV